MRAQKRHLRRNVASYQGGKKSSTSSLQRWECLEKSHLKNKKQKIKGLVIRGD